MKGGEALPPPPPGSRRLPVNTAVIIFFFHFVRINGNSIHCWYYLLSMANPISENRIVERSWTDARRWIFTHKELKAPVNNTSKREPSKVPPLWERNDGRRSEHRRKKCWRYLLSMTPVAPIGFNGTTKDVNSGGRLCKPGGALAFNEAQFWWTSWTGLKKGGKHLGNHRCHCHPSAPFRWLHRSSRVSKKKVWFSGKEGGALKFRGASAVFLNGINPGDYDDVLKTMKIHRTTK